MTLKNCPFCHSKEVKKNGSKRSLQRYYCFDCHRYFTSKKLPLRLQKKRFALEKVSGTFSFFNEMIYCGHGKTTTFI